MKRRSGDDRNITRSKKASLVGEDVRKKDPQEEELGGEEEKIESENTDKGPNQQRVKTAGRDGYGHGRGGGEGRLPLQERDEEEEMGPIVAGNPPSGQLVGADGGGDNGNGWAMS